MFSSIRRAKRSIILIPTETRKFMRVLCCNLLSMCRYIPLNSPRSSVLNTEWIHPRISDETRSCLTIWGSQCCVLMRYKGKLAANKTEIWTNFRPFWMNEELTCLRAMKGICYEVVEEINLTQFALSNSIWSESRIFTQQWDFASGLLWFLRLAKWKANKLI